MPKVLVDGVGPVSLGKADFVGSGGQGHVYARGEVAYKVYHDPRWVTPEQKVRELGAIRDPRILKPERLLRDTDGHVVGYTMRFIRGGIPLCQAFTRAFREREGLTHVGMANLVLRLRSAVEGVHDAKVVIVDLNELNVLLTPKLDDLYLLDVDSFQTASFPATVLMDSVRDRHATRWWTGTDWFAFAVLTFQMFVGLHPYRGTHPTVKGLDERMHANLSALRRDVKLPPAAYPLSVIPVTWQTWYSDVLDRGHRGPPPVTFAIPVAQVQTRAPEPQVLKLTRIALPPKIGRLVGYAEGYGVEMWIGEQERQGRTVSAWGDGLLRATAAAVPPERAQAVGISPAGQTVAVGLSAGCLALTGRTLGGTPPALHARAIAGTAAGAVYALARDQIVALRLHDIGGKLHVTLEPVATVLEHATRLYDGVALQDLLGACYATLLGEGAGAPQVRLPSLDGARVVGAKYDRKTLVVVAALRGEGVYSRLTFTFADDWSSIVSVDHDVDAAEPSFAVLDSGVVVSLQDGKLVLRRPGHPGRRVVEDQAISGSWRLFRFRGGLGALDGDEAFALALS